MRTFIVEGDGVVYERDEVEDSAVRDMIRFGNVVVMFRISLDGVEYAEVDSITHEVEWKTVEKEE